MSSKDTFAKLRSDEGDAFDFIGRSAETPPSKPGSPERQGRSAGETKQISVRIDVELHRRLKLHLAAHNEEQQELVARLIEAHLDASETSDMASGG